MVSIWKWRTGSPLLHKLPIGCFRIGSYPFAFDFRLVLVHRGHSVFGNHRSLQTTVVLIWNAKFTASLSFFCLLYLDVFENLRLGPLSIWTSTSSRMCPHLIGWLLTFSMIITLNLLSVQSVTLSLLHVLWESVELLYCRCCLSLRLCSLGLLVGGIILVESLRLLLR